jgi:hypothetical protein
MSQATAWRHEPGRPERRKSDTSASVGSVDPPLERRQHMPGRLDASCLRGRKTEDNATEEPETSRAQQQHLKRLPVAASPA